MTSICSTRVISLAMLNAAFALAFSVGCGGDDTTGNAADGGGSENGGSSGGGDSFSSIYNSSEFQKCSGCHAPNAPGKTDGIETTEDWSTRATAYASLKGKAAGLIGNFAGCNGVPLIGASAEESLLVASLDETVRMSFTSSSAPDCNADAISDQTLKLGGALPDALLTQLKSWINAGAPDM